MIEDYTSIETFDGIELIEAALLHNVSGGDPKELYPIGCVANSI
jgi:hypothetical protein